MRLKLRLDNLFEKKYRDDGSSYWVLKSASLLFVFIAVAVTVLLVNLYKLLS